MAVIGCLLAVVLCVAGMSARSSLRPAILHNLAWAIGLAIVASGLLRFDPLSGWAWFLILSAVLTFNAGVFLAAAKMPVFVGDFYSHAGQIKLRHLYALLLLFSVGVVGYLKTIATLFGLHVLFSDPRVIRASSDINYLAELPLWAKLAFYLGPLCLILLVFPQFVEGLAGRWWRIPLIVAVAAAQLLTLQRTNLFFALVWGIGALVIGVQPQRRKPTKRAEEAPAGRSSRGRRVAALLAISVVGIVAFQGLASALGKTGLESASFQGSVDERLQGSSWASPLFYASSGVAAFSHLVGSSNNDYPPSRPIVYGDYNPQTWGAATLSGLSKAMPGVRPWNEVAPFTRVPQPTNVYTWLEPWYRDFREVGVIAGSLVMGLIVGSIATRAHRGVAWQISAGLVVGLTFLATFVNRYGMVMSLVTYFAIAVLARLNRKRGASALPAPGRTAGREPHFRRQPGTPSTRGAHAGGAPRPRRKVGG